MGRYTAGGVSRDILAGAVAGVAAIWVADKLDRAIYRAGSPATRRRTEAARPGGMDPAHVLAKRAADAAGVELENPRENQAGRTIHYGIAAGMGALYGLLRGAAPGISAGRGALFGVAMFVLQDEIGNTVLGTAGHPLKYPARDHARGAATHTVFGILTDMITRVIAPWRDQVVIERGPPISERLDQGRQYLIQQRGHLYDIGRQTRDQGRDYLDQGIVVAGRVAERARSYLPEVDVDEARRRGRRYAGQVQDTVRSVARDVDARDLVRRGHQQADRFAKVARGYVPEEPTSMLSRAVKRLLA